MSISGDELKYVHSEGIDAKDTSGIIAFDEIEKKQKWIGKIKPLIPQIIDLEIEDWAELFLYANKRVMLKTPFQKALFLFTMRSGLPTQAFDWQPDNYGPYSRDVEKVVSESKDIAKRRISWKGKVMYEYKLKRDKEAKEIWAKLPLAVKNLIEEVSKELKQLKTVNKIEYFVHAAYPKFAINAV